MSGTNARKALKKGDKEKFFTFLPDESTQLTKKKKYTILVSKSITQRAYGSY
jgi:predicted nucleotidyltransferase